MLHLHFGQLQEPCGERRRILLLRLASSGEKTVFEDGPLRKHLLSSFIQCLVLFAECVRRLGQ